MKTKVIILNYKTPDLTNRLSDLLESVNSDEYDVVVLNNSGDDESASELTAKHIVSSLTPKSFGEGMNWAFQLVINQQDRYDSLLLLNSDIIIHPNNFVSALRKEMFENDFNVISPCLLQPNTTQCYWRQMLNWGHSGTRTVDWADQTAIMIHIDVINKIRKFPDQLNLGWGIEFLVAMICKSNNWKIGVCDHIPIIHLVSQSIEQNKHEPDMQTYCQRAEKNMFDYFTQNSLITQLMKYREYGEQYSFKVT